MFGRFCVVARSNHAERMGSICSYESIRDSIRDCEIDSFTIKVTRVTGFGYRSHFTLSNDAFLHGKQSVTTTRERVS